MIRRTLILTTLILLFATLAEAQQRRPRPPRSRAGLWDLSLQTLYTTSKDYTGSGGSSVSLDDNLGWGFGFGYNINARFNLGLAFNWRSINYQATAVNADDPSDVVQYGSRLDMSTFGLTGDWNILPGPFTPYVHGSLAWMIIDTNIFAGWGTSCWWDPWWGQRCGGVPVTYGASTGAYTLGLGGRFQFNDSFFVRVGYEHIWMDIEAVNGSDMLRVDLGFMN